MELFATPPKSPNEADTDMEPVTSRATDVLNYIKLKTQKLNSS